MKKRRIVFVFVFVLCFLFHILHAKGYSNHVRSLTQRGPRSQFPCSLTDEELQEYTGSRNGRWIVDPQRLTSLEGDIQSLINCTREGDVVLFDVDEAITPSKHIVIPWNLTLTAFTRRNIQRAGSFPSTNKQVIFACPNINEGAFLVQSQEAVFANIVFRECRLSRTSDRSSHGIVVVQNCTSGETKGTVSFYHVSFQNNYLNVTSALEMEAPSCSPLRMVNVSFEKNFCSGTCGMQTSFRTEITDLTLSRTRKIRQSNFPPIIMLLPAGSTSTISNIIASRNDANVLYVQQCNLTLSSSRFVKNTGQINRQGGIYSGGITIVSSATIIKDCEFKRNTGEFGTSIFAQRSNVTFRRATFQQDSCKSTGAGIYLNTCNNVRIIDSSFLNNTSGNLGGSLFSNDTVYLEIKDSLFQGNSAGTGGSINVERTRIELIRSRFISNIATTEGGAIYLKSSSSLISRSIFQNNSAAGLGGAITIRYGSYALAGLRFSRNSAPVGGALCTIAATGFMNNSVLSLNSADNVGGAMYTARSTFLNVFNCTFLQNLAIIGAGLHVDNMFITSVFSSTFIQNNSTSNGGGIFANLGSLLLSNDMFEENHSNSFGGAVSCSRNFLNSTNTIFNRNTASSGGGAIALYGQARSTLLNTSWIGNVASSYGGGVYIETGSFSRIISSRFTQNSAPSGGGLYGTDASVILQNSNCTLNTGTNFGAGVCLFNSTGSITSCSFISNFAAYGAAVTLSVASGNISDSVFVGNRAQDNGGALHCTPPTVANVTNCIFISNFANVSGGGISASSTVFIGRHLQFLDNRAEVNGGGIFCLGSTNFNLYDTVFNSDTCGLYGGAITTSEDTIMEIQNITIQSCSATRGGGMYFYKSTGTLNNTSIVLSSSEEYGGGMSLVNSTIFSNALNISFNEAIGTEEIFSAGGGIRMEDASSLILRNSSIVQNRATFGAGINIRLSSIATLSQCYCYNNSALASGGCLYVESSSSSVENITAVKNSALFGGAIFASNSRLTVNNSNMLNNSATQLGGSICAQDGTFVVSRDSLFQRGTADNGGGVMLTASYFWGLNLQFRQCEASIHGGGVDLNGSSSFLCTECLFADNNAISEGGALRLDSNVPQLLAFQLRNNMFRNNEATFGGGIHFRTGDGSANCSDILSTDCTFLALEGCILRNNYARSAGGGILANNPTAIRINCVQSNSAKPFAYYTRREFGDLNELATLEKGCKSWKGNKAEVYGQSIGSYARRVSKTIVYEQNSTEIEIPYNRYVIRNHPSGVPLPSLCLQAVDEFDQGPALIQNNELIEAVMTSPDGLFAGTFTVQMEESKGNFTGVTGFKEPGSYDVRIDFSEQSMPTLLLVVEIRDCAIGEAKAVNGTFCQLCGADSYNFSPEKVTSGCSPCPEDASCDSVVIRPKPGFWHQTPCSNHIQDCLSDIACKGKNRDKRLKELGSEVETCEFDEDFIKTYSEALCEEGYIGPLCGSCADSYGKSRSFRCAKCFGNGTNVLLVFFAIMVLLGLTGFTIRSSLPSHARMPGTPPSHPAANESRRSIPVNHQMVEMLHTGIVPQEIINPELYEDQDPQPLTEAEQDANQNIELAKWKAVEIFKISVNYLQVIAIAIAVNVDWTNALIIAFEATGNLSSFCISYEQLLFSLCLEFLSGVTSEAATRSTDCLISDDSSVPRSAVRTIINLLVPAFVTSLFVTFWAVIMIYRHETLSYLAKRCMLSAMAVSYISYITITKTAVNILYCVKVYDSWDFENDDVTRYWAVDTELKCYEGPHTVLAVVFGWPTLVLFSFGFPVLVASLLTRERFRKGIHTSWLFETAGFMYRSYSQQYVYWESLILLRKALLAVVVVFAYPLGGNLQGCLAVCVLMIALYLHIVCSPFRAEFHKLNELEGLSLLISSLTFVSGLFFNDDRTSTSVRALISAFLLFANIGLLFYFLSLFFIFGINYLRAILDAEEVSYNQNASSISIFKFFLQCRLEEHYKNFTIHLSSNNSAHPGDTVSAEI